jgi:hypothetical protein
MTSAADVAQRLTMVLGELVFPAARWTIQTYVDHYGADIHTRREIWELPTRDYLTLGDVIDAVIVRIPGSHDRQTIRTTGAPPDGRWSWAEQGAGASLLG